MRPRCAFTLTEILVSLLIFSIVSLAMIGILITSTNIFRSGEFGRAATDEAVAALGVIDEDLRRMIPGHDNGFFYAILHDPAGNNASQFCIQPPYAPAENAPQTGNCATAFLIYTPHPDQIGSRYTPSQQQAQGTQTGTLNNAAVGARVMVVYFVEQEQVEAASLPASAQPMASGALLTEEVLYRLQVPIISELTPLLATMTNLPAMPAGVTMPTTDVQFAEQLLTPSVRRWWLNLPSQFQGQAGAYLLTPPGMVARRVLHFGTWISTDTQPRSFSGNWVADTSNNAIPPLASATATSIAPYSTEADTPPVGTVTQQSFPTAVLFTMALAAGRFAPTGTVVADLGGSPEQIRITGIGALPSLPGSKIRIGPPGQSEWVQYTSYQNGILTLALQNDPYAPTGGRGALRSTPLASITHGLPVAWGQMYSLARVFPH